MDDNELLGLFELMFVEMGLVEEFKIDLGVLRRFLSVVRENYNNNMYGLINVTKLIDKLKPVEKLILTVAYLDHPGYNNSYQINDCNIFAGFSDSVYHEARRGIIRCILSTDMAGTSDREKADGLPNAPFMDREKVTKPSAQIGFIAYVMIPMYELVGKVLPNMDKHILHPIRASLNFYKHLLEKEKAEK
ncbi:hypothetical protein BSLG_006023 [Batrachochytrium salamandrivorans]|nr:hypothetical protein BSLG_006023 [Batrachochytrium salamandrivorans]